MLEVIKMPERNHRISGLDLSHSYQFVDKSRTRSIYEMLQ